LAKDSLVWDLTQTFPDQPLDAWFVAGMAGDMDLAMQSLPYFLPWMIFQRDNGKVRRYKFESLTHKIYGKRSTRPNPTAAAQ
jgi:hypothetical protein